MGKLAAFFIIVCVSGCGSNSTKALGKKNNNAKISDVEDVHTNVIDLSDIYANPIEWTTHRDLDCSSNHIYLSFNSETYTVIFRSFLDEKLSTQNECGSISLGSNVTLVNRKTKKRSMARIPDLAWSVDRNSFGVHLVSLFIEEFSFETNKKEKFKIKGSRQFVNPVGRSCADLVGQRCDRSSLTVYKENLIPFENRGVFACKSRSFTAVSTVSRETCEKMPPWK